MESLLTLLEVVSLPDVDEDEGHELELRETLSCGRGQREEVPQAGDLGVDHVPPHLGRPLRRLPVRGAASGSQILLFSLAFSVKLHHFDFQANLELKYL